MTLIKKFPLTLLWILFIFILCSVKLSDIPAADDVKIPNFDKFVHALFFFVLSMLIYFESRKQQIYSFSRLQWTGLILIIAVVYGGAIELMQKYFFTYRSADWFDFLADATGCLLALILINSFFNKQPAPKLVK